MGGGGSKAKAVKDGGNAEANAKQMCKAAIQGASSVQDRETRVNEALKKWDKNGNGTIESDELKGLLEALGAKYTQKDVEELMAAIGWDKSKAISFDELTNFLFCAPNLDKYFKLLHESMLQAEAEATKLVVKKFEAMQTGAGVEAVDKEIETFQTNTGKSLDTQLTPVIEAAFKWHDKSGTGFLEQEEGILFFSNYASRLTTHVESAVTLSLCREVQKWRLLDMTALNGAFKETMELKRAAYLANADARHKAAFAVVDANKDGKLGLEELTQALLPGSDKNKQFMLAFGLHVSLEEVTTKVQSAAAAPSTGAKAPGAATANGSAAKPPGAATTNGSAAKAPGAATTNGSAANTPAAPGAATTPGSAAQSGLRGAGSAAPAHR